ncbi:MAG: HAMP domain-containing histidine kinase [Clostridiales bacterium]|jgi:signal transduction histidine kinase|nr:HAMP domain-containing histidine kinase [Clostridiales bacterium]
MKRTDDFMAHVAENDGFFLQPRSEHSKRQDKNYRDPLGGSEMMRAGRFFYAKLDDDGAIIELNLDMMFDFSKDDAQSYIADALNSGKTKGAVDNFSFLLSQKFYGQILVLVERSIEIGILEELTSTSVWTASIASVILLGLASFLAQWMIAPIRAAFDKQRRFISDASHELKTPLTIIGTNADVLRNEIGENMRLEHIKSQSERMNGLVCDLLAIAKADESTTAIIKNEFLLSNAVLNTVLEFECRAFEEGKNYSYAIAENLSIIGDEGQIKKLVGILVDNAIKHSDVHGGIKVTLSGTAKHPCISVFNTGAGIPDAEKDKIFDRFYRSDESRSRETGGYGLGLAIGKAIADAHNGKIEVTGKYREWIQFTVSL